MGYAKIPNLHKAEAGHMMIFKTLIALEKIHGTSSHITFKADEPKLIFFSGGAKHESFVALFDHDKLYEAFKALGKQEVTVYGEVYGGKMQKMSATYGPDLKFIAFEVHMINELKQEHWLNVLDAHAVVTKLGLDFVHFKLIDANMEAINAERDADSVQAVRNGMGPGKMREGIVLRPPTEVYDHHGGRFRAKHKRAEFSEQKEVPELDGEAAKLYADAHIAADQFVVRERLNHVLDKLQPNETKLTIRDTKTVIQAMINDVYAECSDQIVQSKALEKAIGNKTVQLFKIYLGA